MEKQRKERQKKRNKGDMYANMSETEKTNEVGKKRGGMTTLLAQFTMKYN